MNYRRDVTSVIQIGEEKTRVEGYYNLCLLYTSDAADE